MSPRGRLNEAIDRIVEVDRASVVVSDGGTGHWDRMRQAVWSLAAGTVADLEARGELGWLTPRQVAHYLQRQGPTARAFVVQELVPRTVPEAR